MFTGIIQDIGTIRALEKKGDWILTIEVEKLSLAHTVLGASMACSGVCLTIIEKSDRAFKVQLSTETLAKTTASHWQIGTRINLEPALRMGDELGGHWVSGHVDGLATLIGRQTEGDSIRLRFSIPAAFAKYIAPKGSVTLDGVSLTVNEVEDATFGVNIVPHTQNETTLGALQVGVNVNFEIDLLARYVARMLPLHSK